ncbi:hypothetical protein HER39_14340, partial [Arthrobacter deserti]|nr:hypothetical protein [Arthrobacter deserti]
DAKTVTQPGVIMSMVAPFQKIAPEDIRRAAVYVAHQRVALNYRMGHVLLAGDAAHMMPPFAGQALNAGVRDVANLAWKVAANVRGTGTDALVDTYAVERRPHAVEMVRLSERIGKVVMNVNPTLTMLRDSAITALGIVPAAKNWLAGMKFLKQPHFTGGCTAVPAADVPRAAASLVGRSLSQPQVQLATGDTAALDTVLGAGWARLRFLPGGSIEIRQLGRTGHDGTAAVQVVDPTGAFAPLIGTGLVLLVRPDRYIAAVATAAGEPDALHALSAYAPELTAAAPAAAQAG